MRKNNTLKRAIRLSLFSSDNLIHQKNRLTKAEGSDLFRLDVVEPLTLDVSLSDLKRDLDIEFYSLRKKRGRVLKAIGKTNFGRLRKTERREIRQYLKIMKRGNKTGKNRETINDLFLEPGTYYIRVFGKKQRIFSRYTLDLSVDLPDILLPPVDPPDMSLPPVGPPGMSLPPILLPSPVPSPSTEPIDYEALPDVPSPSTEPIDYEALPDNTGASDWSSSSIWGNLSRWDSESFAPAWIYGQSKPLETLNSDLGDILDEESQDFDFDTSLSSGTPFKYLPFYINGNYQPQPSEEASVEEVDNREILILQIDSTNAPVAFTQETYVIQRSWLSNGLGLESELGDGNSWFLVDETHYPDATPKLEYQGQFLSATVVIVDSLAGTAGDDTINAVAGENTIFGGDGNDTIIGGPIIDQSASSQLDNLHGGEGNDVIRGGDNPALIYGGAGDDHLTASNTDPANFDNLNESDDYSRLYGGTGNDQLFGQDQPDRLDGGLGADWMEGGNGDDIYYVDHPDDVVVETAMGGADSLFITVPGYAVPANIEFVGYGLIGDSGNNVLEGGNDEDELYGGLGDDILNGNGSRIDSGDDRFFNSGDRLYGQGGNDILNGGNGRDILEGGDGNDTLNGSAESDRLIGGLGQDTLNGGVGFDTFVVVTPQDGIDTILDFSAVEFDKVEVSRSGFNIDANDPNRFDRFSVLTSGSLPPALFFDNTKILEFGLPGGSVDFVPSRDIRVV